MNLLVVTPYYAPDLGPSAPMFALLCEELVRRGHTVTVLCAVPHFPSGRVPADYRKGLWRWTEENGVNVCRVRVPSGDRASVFHRMWVFGVYQALVVLAGFRVGFDAALITNPAIETFLPFVFFCRLRRKPCLYAVWDVYPEVGVRMGLFRNPFIIRLVGMLEDYCLRRASRVQVLGDGFRSDLASHELDPEQIAVIPPWLDTTFVRPLPRRNSFSCEHALDDYFVILYAGNLGLSQGLETVVQTANILKERGKILFLFAGEGAGRAALEERARGMANVRFLPHQPRERLPELLASADVSLVVLKQGIGSASLPSKLFSILASGRPALASVDEDSDAWKLVCSSQAGLCVPPESPARLAEAILSLHDDPARCEAMGGNGRAWVERHHSPQSAAEQFERLFASIFGH
ncbi:MAG: glycosyltransferase family 4 protein [Anaerolineales bacterium]